MTGAYLQRIATAVPDHDIHGRFVEFAMDMLAESRAQSIFERLEAKSEIHHRYSCLEREASAEGLAADIDSFYARGSFPSTAGRMKLFEAAAPLLARRALDRLAITAAERNRIGHVIVTCCTGFYAPGLDFDILDHLGLPDSTGRTFIGFMGCYAAINALELARHIVRSHPRSNVLVVNLELCTLHFHESRNLEEVLAFLLFGDGCAGALVGSDATGFAIDEFHALRIDNSRDMITWRIGDIGFDMFLSTHVPMRIARAMREHVSEVTAGGAIELWAVHPGGRAVLDAVEEGLGLNSSALDASRSILSRFGNMSSASVMFVLEQIMQQARSGQRGCALGFGPGVTAEMMRFHAV